MCALRMTKVAKSTAEKLPLIKKSKHFVACDGYLVDFNSQCLLMRLFDFVNSSKLARVREI